MMIVGAGARLLSFDLPLNLTHGRSTTDWDIGVQLDSWEAFREFRERACATGGFGGTRIPHRLMHRATGIPLDIVPFGGIAENDTICWPDAEALKRKLYTMLFFWLAKGAHSANNSAQ